MKNIIGIVLIIIALCGCNNHKNFNPEDTLYMDTFSRTITYRAIEGSIDSVTWMSIDTIYGDTVLIIDNSNYYRYYKFVFVPDTNSVMNIYCNMYSSDSVCVNK